MPKLPVVLEKLTLIPYVSRPYDRQDVFSCQGRHLAYTTKDSRFIEWGLYVPTDGIPAKQASYQYRGHYRLNNEEDRPLEKFNPVWGTALDADEFDSFVLEAMRELSDDGLVPEHVTHDNVLDLIRRIKESVAQ